MVCSEQASVQYSEERFHLRNRERRFGEVDDAKRGIEDATSLILSFGGSEE